MVVDCWDVERKSRREGKCADESCRQRLFVPHCKPMKLGKGLSVGRFERGCLYAVSGLRSRQ